jgi:hypothetical protein
LSDILSIHLFAALVEENFLTRVRTSPSILCFPAKALHRLLQPRDSMAL